MPEIEITNMRRVHLTDVMRIEKEAFSTPWTEEMFRQEVEDNEMSRSFVALYEGRLIGYFVAWFIHDQVHLLNIAVASSHKRRGIAKRMLEYLIDLSTNQNKQMITLEVRESNESAIALYRAFGFIQIGLRREYYTDDKENAVLMLKYLSTRRDRTGEGEDAA